MKHISKSARIPGPRLFVRYDHDNVSDDPCGYCPPEAWRGYGAPFTVSAPHKHFLFDGERFTIHACGPHLPDAVRDTTAKVDDIFADRTNESTVA